MGLQVHIDRTKFLVSVFLGLKNNLTSITSVPYFSSYTPTSHPPTHQHPPPTKTESPLPQWLNFSVFTLIHPMPPFCSDNSNFQAPKFTRMLAADIFKSAPQILATQLKVSSSFKQRSCIRELRKVSRS